MSIERGEWHFDDTRMDVRFVTSLNKNNSPLVIPVSIVTQYARFKS